MAAQAPPEGENQGLRRLPGDIADDLIPLDPDDAADEFEYEDLVHDLAALVKSVPDGVNIALFGPWGSGKSFVGRRLRDSLEPAVSAGAVRFAIFDAFKYTDLSLRREFVRDLGEQLGLEERRAVRDLYTSQTTTRFVLPGRDSLRLLLVYLAILALLIGIAVGVAAIVDLFSPASFTSIVNQYALPMFFAPAIAAGFLTLAGKGMSAEHAREAPSGPEEFERLFRRIVALVPEDRIVIFVDELDRCPADEIVNVLDGLRTFMDQPRCVFVVAVDQQVLEFALRRRLRQVTPEDPRNPYYSAGSSFIDKVFPFQLALPPLRTEAVSRFALELVDGRRGIWQSLPDVHEVLYVLIPAHVVSPRRVKVLLNAYAMTHRLIRRRAIRDSVGREAPERTAELAKLVCRLVPSSRCSPPTCTSSPSSPRSCLVSHKRSRLTTTIRCWSTGRGRMSRASSTRRRSSPETTTEIRTSPFGCRSRTPRTRRARSVGVTASCSSAT